MDIRDVMERLSADSHFAQVTVQRNGANLAGWRRRLSNEEVVAAVAFARSICEERRSSEGTTEPNMHTDPSSANPPALQEQGVGRSHHVHAAAEYQADRGAVLSSLEAVEERIESDDIFASETVIFEGSNLSVAAPYLSDGQRADALAAARQRVESLYEGVWIGVVGPVSWPRICSCCARGQPETAYTLTEKDQESVGGGPQWTTYTWRSTANVPVCTKCMAHIEEAQSRGSERGFVGILIILVGVALIAIILSMLGDNEWAQEHFTPIATATIVGVLALCFLAIFLFNKSMPSIDEEIQLSPNCTQAHMTVHYSSFDAKGSLGHSDPDRVVHSFGMINRSSCRAFIRAFLTANPQAKLR